MIKLTEQRPDGVCVYTLENDQLKAVITSRLDKIRETTDEANPESEGI